MNKFQKTGLAGLLGIGVWGIMAWWAGPPGSIGRSPEISAVKASAASSRATTEVQLGTPLVEATQDRAVLDLNDKIERARKALPRMETVRTELPDGAHEPPETLTLAAGFIGELEELLEGPLGDRPEARQSANRFFLECASDRGLLPAIRALCLHTLKKKRNLWHPEVLQGYQKLDPELLNLESQL